MKSRKIDKITRKTAAEMLNAGNGWEAEVDVFIFSLGFQFSLFSFMCYEQ